MTNYIMNVLFTGVTLATLATAPALAQCPACALAYNGLANNVLTQNALSYNALSANSVGALGRVVAVELPRR